MEAARCARPSLIRLRRPHSSSALRRALPGQSLGGAAGTRLQGAPRRFPMGGVVILKSRLVPITNEIAEPLLESALALRADGSTAWETALPAEHVGSDASGKVYTALDFEGEVRIGATTLSACGRRGIAVAGLDAGGTIAWVRELGSGDLVLRAFAVHDDGSSLVAGFFQGELTIDGQTHRAPPLEAIGFLAALDADGRILWSRASVDGSLSASNAVALANGGTLLTNGLRVFEIDSAGTVVQSHTLGIDGYTVLARTSDRGFVLGSIVAEGALLASYDAGGVPRWSKNLGSYSYLPSVAIGPAGEIVALVGSPDEPRAHLMAFDTSGEPVWSWSFANVLPLNASLASTRSALFLSGNFAARADLGGATLESAGCDDGFIAQLR